MMRVAVVLLALCAGALAKGPLIAYECAKKCTDKYGWKPVCVADGRGRYEDIPQGTLYPNSCAYKKCVAVPDTKANMYNYLPLDCGSAVACSLMGRSVTACKKAWEAAEDGSDNSIPSPKVDDNCSCGISYTKPPPCQNGKKGCSKCYTSGLFCRSCLAGWRRNTDSGTCQKCAYGCRYCPEAAQICTVCRKGFKLSKDKCVKA